MISADGRSHRPAPRGRGLLLVLAAVPVFAALAGGVGRADALALRHLELEHALPGPDSVMTTPVTEVRLFFSEPPQMRATTIRIVDGSRSLMGSSPPSAYEGDPRQVYVRLEEPLPPGSYVVQWRVMAQDGHVQRDDFGFQVASE